MSVIKKNKSLLVFLLDLIFISLSFFLATYLKRGYLVLNKDYGYLLFSLFSIWFISSLLSKRYNFSRPKNIREGLNPFFRSFFYLCILLFFIIFIFKLFAYSRFIILATLIIYFTIEIVAYSVFYILKWGPNVRIVNEDNNPTNHGPLREQPNKEASIDFKDRQVKESLKSKLKETFSKGHHSPIFTNDFHHKLFNFLDSEINLAAISASDSLMIDTNNADNIYSILNNRHEFIGNFRNVNDFQRINQFFIAVNQKLIWGGYFFGIVETLEQRLDRKFSKFPRLLRKFLYLLDFIWTRIFPKLALLKNLYFTFRGKDRRIISKYEILGRLYFCGFKIVKIEEIDKKLYFIVKKVRTFLEDKHPSYGPIFKQKRIGLNGEIIYVYKFRTMYPYSEYLYDFLSGPKKFDGIAKVENDVRTTSWGRFLRKFWIDEIPMLINLLQGDLKLIGIRPISEALYNTRFPEDLRKTKLDIKPGIIPACYGEISKSIEEVWESEKRYMEKFRKHQLKTDFIYFFRIINNILFHKVRSE